MLWFQTNLTKDKTSEKVHALGPPSPMYLGYHPVLSLALSEPTPMCMLVEEAWQQQSLAEIVPVGAAVLAGAVGVNGFWGPWGEERHVGMQLDLGAVRHGIKKTR